MKPFQQEQNEALTSKIDAIVEVYKLRVFCGGPFFGAPTLFHLRFSLTEAPRIAVRIQSFALGPHATAVPVAGIGATALDAMDRTWSPSTPFIGNCSETSTSAFRIVNISS